VKTKQTVKLNISKLESQSWDKAFRNNIISLDWAINNAPFKYIAPLIDTKSIIKGIQLKLIGD